jgi:hypothetical protein
MAILQGDDRSMTELEIQFGTALWNGDIELVRGLLAEHPDLSSILSHPGHQKTYFERAATSDSLEIVQFMVQHGADIHAPLDRNVNVGIVYSAVRKGALKVTTTLRSRWDRARNAPVS